ncbi:hypothetical protein H1Q58_05970 [Planococcus maritimus]|uniref:RNA polymerase sigma factor 70 region 4 type 2 domain-containing protein n=1 Tax=Planococcus maritimus TaxID=192421 RepID=A0A7D7MI32_PLAMR|nr:hypothetical protein [Planococcus maritimus]QMT18531.1 hypothetical protein H1Q58_05970 [Planococcus maritimus]
MRKRADGEMDENNNPVSGTNEPTTQLAEELRRFAYQNGMSAERTDAFIQNVWESVGNLDAADDTELYFYRAAAEQLAQFPDLQNDGSLIGFQEDRESHFALQSLPFNQRIATVLYLVNGRNLSFAAQVLQLNEPEMLSYIDSAKSELAMKLAVADQQELLQRLEFLEKSIKRLKLPDREVLMEDHISPAEAPQPQVPAAKKPAIWIVAAAIAMLAGVVGASFFFDSFRLPSASEATAGQLTQEMAEEMEQQYEETRENAKQRLGLEEEEFVEFAYVAGADEEKDRLFSRSELKQHEDDAELFAQQVEELLWRVETPKGMTESLVNSGHMQTDEIDRFMQLYLEKTNELQDFAEGILKNNEDQLPAASEHYGEPQLLIEDIPDASAELQQLLTGWSEYGLRFRLTEPDRMYLLIKDTESLQWLPQFQTHPFAHMYLEIFAVYPYFDEQGWLVEPFQLSNEFYKMLYLLVEEPTDSKLKAEIEVIYEQTVWQILKGAEQDIYTDGVVKPEIREFWKTLTYHDALAAILLPVIDEMEDSGWQHSAFLDNLEYGDSLRMLELAKQGELSETLPNGDFQVESEMVDLADFDYSRVKELYARFKQSHDTNLLAGVQPLDVYFLYFYANHEKDPETMYHLLADSELKPSLEEYMVDWEPIPELTETALWVEIREEMTQRIYEKVMIHPSVMYEEQDIGFHQSNPLQPALVTERDQIWMIQYELQEFSQGSNPELQKRGLEAYELLANNKKLPDDTRPFIIAYALLHAIDNENIAVANKLLQPGVEGREAEFWRNFASSHMVAGFENMTSMSFAATDLNVLDQVDANLQISYEMEESEVWHEQLMMVLTPEGWRFELFPNY